MDDRLTRDLLAPLKAIRPHPLKCVPILGFLIEQAQFSRAANPIVAKIEAILAARDEFSIEGWGSDETTQRVALATLRVLVEEMDWESDRFRPEDEVRVAFWSHSDGLNFEFALIELADRLDLEDMIEEAGLFYSGTVGVVTLGEFVTELARRVRDRESSARAPSARGGGSRPGCRRRSAGRP